MLVEFPEYLPDFPALENPGSTVVKNVLPCGLSYEPLPSLVAYSDALSAYARGFVYVRVPTTGASTAFAGDGTKLYQMSSATWANVSLAGNYTLAADDTWQFTQFGANVLATNITNQIQTFTVGTSSNFANLSATAPLARYIDSVRDFVVVANTYDAIDGFMPNRVRWPGIGGTTAWTVSASTQADYQDLDAKFGWCTQIIGGEYGVIFQEQAITRMDYVGSPLIFEFNTVEKNEGTQIPNSVISKGRNIFYIGIDGFKVFDGTRTESIGDNKIDKTFLADFDSSYPYRVSAGIDFKNDLVCWVYPGVGNSSGQPNKMIIFNYSRNAKKRWSYAEFDSEFLTNSFTEGYTLDGLDTYQTNIQGVSPNIDVLPFSLDSRIWTGNNLLISAFNSNHKLSNFTGTALTALIETAEVQLSPGNRTNVLRVKPLIDGSGTVTVQIGTRNLQSESVSYTSTVSLDSTGECQVRSNARYHRLRVNVTGGFTHAIGFEILESRKAGKR